MELPQIKHVHKPLILVFVLFIVLANCGFSFPSEPQGMPIKLIVLYKMLALGSLSLMLVRV